MRSAVHSPLIYLGLGLLGLVIAWGVLLLSLFLHEIGHAAAARLNGYRVTSLGVGTGKPIARIRVGETLLYLCGFQHGLLGLTWVYSVEPFPSRTRQLRILLGGATANILLGVTAVLLLSWLLSSYTVPPLVSVLALTIALINSGMGLLTALPLRLPQRGSDSLSSDGRQALALLLRPRSGGAFLPPQRQLTWRSLWESIGDTDALTVHLLNAAAEYEEIGAREAVSLCLSDAESLTVTPETALYRDAWTSLLKARLENDTTSESLFSRLQSEGGKLLVRRERAKRDKNKSWRERDTELANLAEHSLAQENPALLLRLLMDRLVVLLESGPAEEATLRPHVELLSSRYESVRQRASSTRGIDRIAFDAIATLREKLGDDAGAQIAQQRAKEAARAIEIALADDPLYRPTSVR